MSRLKNEGHRIINGPGISGSGDYVAVVLEGNQIELMA